MRGVLAAGKYAKRRLRRDDIDRMKFPAASGSLSGNPHSAIEDPQ
jgi:hypothetical protein